MATQPPYNSVKASGTEVAADKAIRAIIPQLDLVFGIPMACYLAIEKTEGRAGGVLRFVNYAYLPTALLGITLSGTRSAMLAVVPGAVFGLWSLTKIRTRVQIFVLLLLALLATACDQPRPVQVVAGADRLPGLYWEPPKPLSRAVLLVHMLGRSKEDWIPLATRLRQAGYGVLAIDLREQGRTGAPELLADLRAGFDFLRAEKKVDATRIGIVGASIGANAALNLAAQEPLVRLTALLSPGLNYRGVTTEPALRDYGARPLFLAAAEEPRSRKVFDTITAGRKRLIVCSVQPYG